MLLELLNELLNDLSPFYLYLSLVISNFHLGFLQFGLQYRSFENQIYIRKCHNVQFRLLPKLKITPRIIELRTWICTITKKTESVDDPEAPSLSINIMIKRQGGKKWSQNLYSLSLKNIAFF
ncbi:MULTISPECIES: hypothetical protein [Bacillaceae]|uniref:Uncharacterized protein n=1 Tax=Oceanobacillus caeni TaxID=405946 RepID=A0ABR5MM33_9BACI|nr:MULTISPECIES: hypothetical protein [Bacillaceae]KPH77462.1 hypothetical protein AFL42_03585 [Oceanobacillus caeni]MED4473047.1 hypothetical protein [Oceanobacillus caeni]